VILDRPAGRIAYLIADVRAAALAHHRLIGSGPSAFHDVYPDGSGRGGIHHAALFVDD